MSRLRKPRSKPQPKKWSKQKIVDSLVRAEPGCTTSQKYLGYLRLQQEIAPKSNPQS